MPPTVAEYADKIRSLWDMPLPEPVAPKTQRELEAVLILHKTWLDSIGVPSSVIRGRRANLRGANLSGMKLIRRDLRGADLSGANLEGASLAHSDFSMADLRGTNLSNADLTGAKLDEAETDGVLV